MRFQRYLLKDELLVRLPLVDIIGVVGFLSRVDRLFHCELADDCASYEVLS